MAHPLLFRFERRVVRPLSFALAVLIILLVFRRHFLVCLPLAVLWFSFGMVGQALHKDLSARQLARGEHLLPPSTNELEPLLHEDAYQFAKAAMGLGVITATAALIVLLHFGWHWYAVVPLSMLIWFLTPVLSFLVVGGESFLRIWLMQRKKKRVSP